MELSVPFGKVHDLLLLVQMLPFGEEIEEKFGDDLIALTHYATTVKYSARSPSVDDMERAFEAAPLIVSLIQ